MAKKNTITVESLIAKAGVAEANAYGLVLLISHLKKRLEDGEVTEDQFEDVRSFLIAFGEGNLGEILNHMDADSMLEAIARFGENGVHFLSNFSQAGTSYNLEFVKKMAEEAGLPVL
jgi:hypothetical protein